MASRPDPGKIPEPSQVLRQFVKDALRATGVGGRRFEAQKGLPKWSLRGLMDPQQQHSPSVDRAAEICEALGLEFYIGPPRKGRLDPTPAAAREARSDEGPGRSRPREKLRAEIAKCRESLDAMAAELDGAPDPQGSRCNVGRLTDPLLEAISKSRRSARDISICAVGNAGAVRNLKRRMELLLSTFEALCRELGLEIYIGPPREEPRRHAAAWNVRGLCKLYMGARNIAGSTLCHEATGNGTVWQRLPIGRVTIRTLDRLVQYLSDHWPEGLIWPDDIPRPEPRTEREEAA